MLYGDTLLRTLHLDHIILPFVKLCFSICSSAHTVETSKKSSRMLIACPRVRTKANTVKAASSPGLLLAVKSLPEFS